MTDSIRSPIPSSERIPGVRQRIALRRKSGLRPSRSRVLLIGWRLADKSDLLDLVPVRVRTRAEASSLAGSGSQLDLMVRAALDSAKLARGDTVRGTVPELYAMPIAPLAGTDGTAAVHRITFANSAASTGPIFIRVAQETITVRAAVGDTASDLAARLNTEIARAIPNLPVTSTHAGAVVTLPARERGAWGSELVISADTSAVAGVAVTIAETTAGAGNMDLELALAAAMPFQCDAVVIGEDTTAARTALKAHVREAWDFSQSQYRLGICASGGDLSDAQTAAKALDEWRIVLVNAEKVSGTGVPYDGANSSPAFSFEAAAAVGTRLYSQPRPNFNFNLASLAVKGRPRTVNRDNVNDAIAAGVTVVLAHGLGIHPGQILDPISTATTDQTGQAPGAPDPTWAPIEIAKVVQSLTNAVQAELAGITQLDGDEQSRLLGKAAALAILRAAAKQRWIAPVDDDQVEAAFDLVDGATHLVLELNYGVIVGVDIVAVSHNVTRAV